MIRKKLQVMMVITLAAALMMAVVSNWSLRAVQNASGDEDRLASLLRNHLEADMMHEAIRADVLLALREATRYSNDGIAKAKASIQQHVDVMTSRLARSEEIEMSPKLRTAFDEVKPALQDYKTEAEQVIGAAAQDPLTADQRFASFDKMFYALEEKLAVISDQIQEEITVSDAEVKSMSDSVNGLLLAVSAIMLLFTGMVCYQVMAKLLGPLEVSMQSMLQLSQGNLDTDITGTDRKDEIGSMVRALQVFRDNALRTKQMEQERIHAERRAQDEKKGAMSDLALRFEQRVQGIITSVASASTELLQTAQGMTTAMEDANSKASSVARSAERTTGNVQTVASAAEQMTASVKEISSQVTKSTQVVADTVSKAEHADDSAKQLEGAAQQIGHVVQLIQDIAEQINLLALNATIESARAGDAGKGFAVVASEVKNLATQTTKATEEIATQIEGIQTISKGVVEALNAIKYSIDQVSEYSSGIASAVEEQSAVTDEIAANMQNAASGTNDIRVNINEVTSSAMSAKDAAMTVLEASRNLSKEAEVLSREVAEFLSEIRG